MVSQEYFDEVKRVFEKHGGIVTPVYHGIKHGFLIEKPPSWFSTNIHFSGISSREELTVNIPAGILGREELRRLYTDLGVALSIMDEIQDSTRGKTE